MAPRASSTGRGGAAGVAQRVASERNRLRKRLEHWAREQEDTRKFLHRHHAPPAAATGGGAGGGEGRREGGSRVGN